MDGLELLTAFPSGACLGIPGIYRSRERLTGFDRGRGDPKRKRGSRLGSSLTHRVTINFTREHYNQDTTRRAIMAMTVETVRSR